MADIMLQAAWNNPEQARSHFTGTMAPWCKSMWAAGFSEQAYSGHARLQSSPTTFVSWAAIAGAAVFAVYVCAI